MQVRVDIVTLHDKNDLCIVAYHTKFPIIKVKEDLLADSQILACKIIFWNIAHREKQSEAETVILF